MANEIDELMSLDPLQMTPDNIDSIIAYHRKNRANAAAGIKPKKEAGPKISLGDLVSNMLANKPPAAPGSIVKRRI